MTLGATETLPNRPVDMLLRFSCPMCSTVLEIPRSRTGLEGPCPACGATIIAPSVVIASPSQQKSSPMADVSPEPRQTKESANVGTDEVPVEMPTTRLCDLPPCPAFAARDAGNLPEPTDDKMERKRRKRRAVSMNKPTLLNTLKCEFWMILLALVVLAVAAAVAIFGDRMFSGLEATPVMQR